MEKDLYLELKQKIIDAGYAEDIRWARNIQPCSNYTDFFCEYMWVVVNSGMKNTVARIIERRIYDAWSKGQTADAVFGHKGKADAIEHVRMNSARLFKEYGDAEDKLAYLETLPWIGEITKFHLAKNLGIDCAKPDRHLTRIAASRNTDAFTLCKNLAAKTGDSLSTVDTVLWRAASLGMI